MRNHIVARTRKVPSYHFGPALFLQHTSSPAVDLMTPKDYFDAREGPVPARPEPKADDHLYHATAESIEIAKEVAAFERAQYDAQNTLQKKAMEEDKNALLALVAKRGVSLLRFWIREAERRQEGL